METNSQTSLATTSQYVQAEKKNVQNYLDKETYKGS